MKYLLLILLLLFPLNFCVGAIARDTSVNYAPASATVITKAFTVTGTNPILLISVWDYHSATSPGVSSVTYAGASCTQIANIHRAATDHGYLYYIVNPSTGTNNIVVTYNSTVTYPSLVAWDYTGVDQTTPFVSRTNYGPTTATTFSMATTTTVDNSWVVGGVWTNNNPCTMTSGTIIDNHNGEYVLDGGNKTPVGSVTLSANCTGSGTWIGTITFIRPYVDAGGGSSVLTPFVDFYISDDD